MSVKKEVCRLSFVLGDGYPGGLDGVCDGNKETRPVADLYSVQRAIELGRGAAFYDAVGRDSGRTTDQISYLHLLDERTVARIYLRNRPPYQPAKIEFAGFAKLSAEDFIKLPDPAAGRKVYHLSLTSDSEYESRCRNTGNGRCGVVLAEDLNSIREKMRSDWAPLFQDYAGGFPGAVPDSVVYFKMSPYGSVARIYGFRKSASWRFSLLPVKIWIAGLARESLEESVRNLGIDFEPGKLPIREGNPF